MVCSASLGPAEGGKLVGLVVEAPGEFGAVGVGTLLGQFSVGGGGFGDGLQRLPGPP
ncbi:hypothetical protein F4561_001421 [Lipingzhangella halophila]|uniref:Uncharacterized protein n=1 Tax=Lipingzhangella halophila TaxID=1783352 RepID=A0A7W7W1G4_9ACTN|nr:hypothetical protein [Lipingzhangella halophila]